MRKLRVYELGRHYGVDSKQIMALLQKMKVQAKSHMSVVEDEDVDKVHAVFQRKRELARENYARSHGLNPDQLKNVAALKPLEKPVPSDEPEPEVKVTKKKVTKKKAPAKPTVLVIKKAGQATAVSKRAQAEKDAVEQARQAEIDRRRADEQKREADLARSREEHAQARQVVKARLVKKADLPKPEEPVAAPEPIPQPVAAPVEIHEPAPVVTAGSAEQADETIGTQAGEAAAPADEANPPAAPATAAGPAAVDPLAGIGTKKHDGYKIGDIVRPAPKVRADQGAAGGAPGAAGSAAAAAAAAAGGVTSESVRDSIKAAIQRRRDEAESRDANQRAKRARKKKKKVDEVEVQRAVKQTMAQLGSGLGKRKRRKGESAEDDEPVETTLLKLTEFITVQELADKLQVRAQELIAKLFSVGIMATINQRLEKTNIELLAAEYDREVEFLSEYGEEMFEEAEVDDADLVDRPPVVTVMGHVDHGKTSLLDRIRKTNVIAGEAGGITQHIGAYTVATDKGPITFLDTPGHAAFTAMRARGAQVTDIVILIVAADDRVMPQTVEAISHAKAAGVPMIVAINKIDLPGSRPELVKHELLQHGIAVEEFGGTTMIAEISAKKGIGIENLLELIHLQAEVLELKASPKGPARGIVIEAKKEQGRGVVFTVLVEQGTLKMGDNFLAGMVDGKVRALQDERGKTMKVVMPGEPCEVLGASNVPEAGDRFYVVESEREARELAAKRRSLQRQQKLVGPKQAIDLDNLAALMTTGDLKELPIIIKGDVAGSVEALADQLMELNTAEVQIRIMHKAVGAVSESDVLLAANVNAMIIGFHLRPGAAIQELAKRHNVTIEVFDIIYEAVDTLKKAMAGLLGSIKREVSTGRAQVRAVFRIPKVGAVAGSMVLDGVIKRNSRARLVRNEMVVFEGKVNSLKRFKEDVREVATGYECGIGLEHFYDIEEGDVLECYEIEEIKRTEL
ncbi:MAG: translation initiation factor IF-2 [bacterium]|nr:translation initiation factor IF-2 [bacterium]